MRINIYIEEYLIFTTKDIIVFVISLLLSAMVLVAALWLCGAWVLQDSANDPAQSISPDEINRMFMLWPAWIWPLSVPIAAFLTFFRLPPRNATSFFISLCCIVAGMGIVVEFRDIAEVFKGALLTTSAISFAWVSSLIFHQFVNRPAP